METDLENDLRKKLFDLWDNYKGKLNIFKIDDIDIDQLKAIVQNDMVITKEELKEWYAKTLKLRTRLTTHLKDDSSILKKWNKLVKKTILYYINSEKVK